MKHKKLICLFFSLSLSIEVLTYIHFFHIEQHQNLWKLHFLHFRRSTTEQKISLSLFFVLVH